MPAAMVPLRAGLLLALLSASLLSGCTQSGSGDGATADMPAPKDPCPQAFGGTRVAGFTGHNGNWSLATAGFSKVCGEGDKAVNSLVKDGLGPFTDFEATLHFQMLERDHPEYDAGAGMVIHFQDDANFQIVRYSPREQGWHLFTMTAGVREKQGDASVTPPTTNPGFHAWVELRVRSEGGHVTAFDGTTKVIDYTLPEGAATSGGVGYFLRAQQAAEFDELQAHAL